MGNYSANEKTHIYAFDLIRIIAIFMVLFNHTKQYGYELYTITSSSISYWMSILSSIACKSGVPLFMMVSGALLLGKQEDLNTVFKKRVFPFFIIFTVMYLLQYIRIVHAGAEDGFSLFRYFCYLMDGCPIAPYWFLRSYLVYLICLPVLRLIAQNMDIGLFHLLVGIELFFSIIGVLRVFLNISNGFDVPFHNAFVFYPLAGYYIMKNKECFLRYKKSCLILLIVILLGTSFFTHLMFQKNGASEYYYSNIIWIITICLFIILISFHFNENSRLLSTIGSCTFGVFLIEDIIRNRFEWIISILSSVVLEIVASYIFVLVVFIVSVILIWIGKKIPGVRFFLR